MTRLPGTPHLPSRLKASEDAREEQRLPRWSSFASLIRLRNQWGTLLLMLPTLWALVVASRGRPSVVLVVIFVVGSLVMRSAGVVINDLADRSIDREVARTRMRPLASGTLTPIQALALLAVLFLTAAALLATLNPLTVALSPVAVLLAGLYPLAKRLVPLPQAVLGLAFGWGVLMAWSAETGTLDPPAWLLYGATIAWAIGYDSIYALQDREDDLRIGVKSAAILFGERTWMAVGIALMMMTGMLGLVGWSVGIHFVFYAALFASSCMFLRQVTEIRDPISPQRAFELFRQHVTAGAILLAGFWLGFF